jgi:hypothetical protein
LHPSIRSEPIFDEPQGGQICLPRITQPEAPAQLILHRSAGLYLSNHHPGSTAIKVDLWGQPEPICAIARPQNQPLTQITS